MYYNCCVICVCVCAGAVCEQFGGGREWPGRGRELDLGHVLRQRAQRAVCRQHCYPGTIKSCRFGRVHDHTIYKTNHHVSVFTQFGGAVYVGSGCAVIVFGGALPVSVTLNTATVPIGNGNTYYLNTAVAMATGVAGFTVRGAYVAFSLPPTALLYCWDHAYVGPLRYGYVGCAPSVLYSSSAPGANGVPPAYVPGKKRRQ
jgi:hypothetical protein